MANYDYQCSQCSEIFEIRHGMMESPEVICPKCKSSEVEKMITGGGGFIMKGRMQHSHSDPVMNVKNTAHPSSCSCCHSNNTCPGADIKKKYGLD